MRCKVDGVSVRASMHSFAAVVVIPSRAWASSPTCVLNADLFADCDISVAGISFIDKASFSVNAHLIPSSPYITQPSHHDTLPTSDIEHDMLPRRMRAESLLLLHK